MQPIYLIIIKCGTFFLPSSSLNAYRSVEVWETVYEVSMTQIFIMNSKHNGEDDVPNLGSAYIRVMVQETWVQYTMNGPYFCLKVGGLFPFAKVGKFWLENSAMSDATSLWNFYAFQLGP